MGETGARCRYSFPGAGNTWVRQLLEQATKLPTTSRYMDATIARVMPHECNAANGANLSRLSSRVEGEDRPVAQIFL